MESPNFPREEKVERLETNMEYLGKKGRCTRETQNKGFIDQTTCDHENQNLDSRVFTFDHLPLTGPADSDYLEEGGAQFGDAANDCLSDFDQELDCLQRYLSLFMSADEQSRLMLISNLNDLDYDQEGLNMWGYSSSRILDDASGPTSENGIDSDNEMLEEMRLSIVEFLQRLKNIQIKFGATQKEN